MKYISILVAVCAFCFSLTPGIAQNNIETSGINAVQSERFDAAHKMATLQAGGTKLTPALVETMRRQTTDALESQEDFIFLETEYPGITKAVVDAMIPVAVRQTEATMPSYINRLARLYAEKMTLEEIQEMSQWLETPLYSRLKTSMEANMDLSGILNGVIEDEEYQISGSDLNKLAVGSALKAVIKMSKEDRKAIAAFSKKPSFRKFRTLKPEADAIETAWSNESTPEEDAELEAATIKAIEEFSGLDLSGIE